jgi:hypothetical protein
MLTANTRELGLNPTEDGVIWSAIIGTVTRYSRISETFTSLVRQEHERRGYGTLPTTDSVGMVVQACEDEGIFGLGG